MQPILLTAEAHWGPWGDYSTCSVTCGFGEQYRYRDCQVTRKYTYVSSQYHHNERPHSTTECEGDNQEKRACDVGCCKGKQICLCDSDSYFLSCMNEEAMTTGLLKLPIRLHTQLRQSIFIIYICIYILFARIWLSLLSVNLDNIIVDVDTLYQCFDAG